MAWHFTRPTSTARIGEYTGSRWYGFLGRGGVFWCLHPAWNGGSLDCAWIAFMHDGEAVACQHRALPFGSVASVHHWDRVGVW